jgi:hypothetical protein
VTRTCEHGLLGCALCAGFVPPHQGRAPTLSTTQVRAAKRNVQLTELAHHALRVGSTPERAKPDPFTHKPQGGYGVNGHNRPRSPERDKLYTTARWSLTREQRRERARLERQRAKAPKPQPVSPNLDEVIADLVNSVRPSAGGTL